MHTTTTTLLCTDGQPENEFCVCVRPLYITSNTLIPRLVEWLEMLELIGVGSVSLFYYTLDPEVRVLLDMYEKERNLVRLQEFILATPAAM